MTETGPVADSEADFARRAREGLAVLDLPRDQVGRIAGLRGSLGQPLLISTTGAARFDGGDTADARRFPLKGIPGAAPVFTPAR